MCVFFSRKRVIIQEKLFKFYVATFILVFGMNYLIGVFKYLKKKMFYNTVSFLERPSIWNTTFVDDLYSV